MEFIWDIFLLIAHYPTVATTVLTSIVATAYTIWRMKKFILQTMEKYFGSTIKRVDAVELHQALQDKDIQLIKQALHLN